MKGALITVASIGLAQLAAAACCRGNGCLKAVVSADQEGLFDCRARLISTVTVTAGAATVTATATDDIEATVVLTTTATETETVATETNLFFETDSVPAATQTLVITETSVAPVTVTDVQTATVTASETIYGGQQHKRAPRSSSPNVPIYAAAVCHSWDHYVRACSCAGVHSDTVTVTAAEVTVTVPGTATATSVVSTLSDTVTDVDSITVTVSTTQTVTVAYTEGVTQTQTDTISSTTTVLQEVTATSVVTFVCDNPEWPFVFEMEGPGGTYNYMNTDSSSNGISLGSAYSTYWELRHADHGLQVSPSGGSSDDGSDDPSATAAFIDMQSTSETVQVLLGPATFLNDPAVAGLVEGCVHEETSAITLSAPGGRSNVLDCGGYLYLSSGDGSDLTGQNCFQVFPRYYMPSK